MAPEIVVINSVGYLSSNLTKVDFHYRVRKPAPELEVLTLELRVLAPWMNFTSYLPTTDLRWYCEAWFYSRTNGTEQTGLECSVKQPYYAGYYYLTELDIPSPLISPDLPGWICRAP